MSHPMGYQKPFPEWARSCSICGAIPNQSCMTPEGVKLRSNHPEHELLGWETKYDETFRELKPREQFGKTFTFRYRSGRAA